MTIVVVDDEFLAVDVLSFALEDLGYQVERAYHGKMAFDLVTTHRPNLVITDFMMPLMTGLELAYALKESPDTAHIPVVLVTGAQGAIARQHADVFAAVFDKPYMLDTLFETVERLIGPPPGK